MSEFQNKPVPAFPGKINLTISIKGKFIKNSFENFTFASEKLQ
jgi:hypothetical protein